MTKWNIYFDGQRNKFTLRYRAGTQVSESKQACILLWYRSISTDRRMVSYVASVSCYVCEIMPAPSLLTAILCTQSRDSPEGNVCQSTTTLHLLDLLTEKASEKYMPLLGSVLEKSSNIFYPKDTTLRSNMLTYFNVKKTKTGNTLFSYCPLLQHLYSPSRLVPFSLRPLSLWKSPVCPDWPADTGQRR